MASYHLLFPGMRKTATLVYCRCDAIPTDWMEPPARDELKVSAGARAARKIRVAVSSEIVGRVPLVESQFPTSVGTPSRAEGSPLRDLTGDSEREPELWARRGEEIT